MDDIQLTLERLKLDKERLSALEKQDQRSYAFWNAWKYFARKEEWYTDFIHTEWIPWEELEYSKKPNDFPSGSPVSREHGERLWEERQGILNNITILKREIIEKILWLRERNVSYAVIGGFYGATAGGVYNFLSDNPIDSIS